MVLSNLLTDGEIAALLSEVKILPPDYLSKVSLKQKRGHKERELDCIGVNGSEFRLILRQALHNVLDFSAIIAYCPAGSSQLFRLRRYNGKSHEHTNQIEKQTFYDFHIHMATERYQNSGLREDAFATPTNRYADFHGGLDCLLTDCSFEIPPNSTLSLF
jgi:hypothetical protein